MNRLSRPTRHLLALRMLRGLPLAAAVAWLIGPSAVLADGVTIEGERPAQSLDISIDKAPISAVLQALHQKYGIEVIDNSTDLASDQVSLTLTGSLPSILERLLRNQNYMIVRSQKNATGVERISSLPLARQGRLKALRPKKSRRRCPEDIAFCCREPVSRTGDAWHVGAVFFETHDLRRVFVAPKRYGFPLDRGNAPSADRVADLDANVDGGSLRRNSAIVRCALSTTPSSR